MVIASQQQQLATVLLETTSHAFLPKVLGEDLVLVKGQQQRMLAGADVWANPVSYDKLGVRYRRWRNSLASGSAAEQIAARQELKPISAGQVFSLEEN